jgi:hypothetical protein
MFDMGMGSFSLIDSATGEKVMESIPVLESRIECKLSTDIKQECTLTMDNVEVSPELLNIIIGNPECNGEIEGIYKRVVQAKKHKKKRINKKWLKRYGYKEIDVPVHFKMDECTMTKDEYDSDTYTFSGEFSI